MPNENINTQTSDKKHGKLHAPGEKHVASQDSLEDSKREEEEE